MNPMSLPVRGRLVVNVEMDDRTVLFPDGLFLSHVGLHEQEDGRIRLEGAFHFNEARHDTHIVTLVREDTRELARSVLDGVFQGRTQHVLSDTARIAVIFNPNGFVLKFGEGPALREMFIGSPAIIRLAQGLLRVADRLAALPPH